jgi:glucosamine 6-phosphate synthetase-like amidotransferase/phosphosugar isomerase protein
MWSSYFISEVWAYFLKNIALNNKVYSYSADEVENNFPYINNEYFVITFSQSWNTKEVSNLLVKLEGKEISNFSLINNINWKHIELSENHFFFDIWPEKSPVSTKYVIYIILFLYKLSLFNWNTSEKIKYLYDIQILKGFYENVFDKYNSILEKLTNKYSLWDNFLIIWNWLNYFIAKEISLKIRETIAINTSYDNIWQLNHWWINSINNKTICILLENDKNVFNKIVNRWWKVITIWENSNYDIKFNWINKYINSIQKIILLQYFVHKLASKLWINTDLKMW